MKMIWELTIEDGSYQHWDDSVEERETSPVHPRVIEGHEQLLKGHQGEDGFVELTNSAFEAANHLDPQLIICGQSWTHGT